MILLDTDVLIARERRLQVDQIAGSPAAIRDAANGAVRAAFGGFFGLADGVHIDIDMGAEICFADPDEFTEAFKRQIGFAFPVASHDYLHPAANQFLDS